MAVRVIYPVSESTKKCCAFVAQSVWAFMQCFDMH